MSIQTAHQGKGTQSAIGLSIVDESVFALGDQDPGFIRTYFLLDRELAKARYEIQDFSSFGNSISPYDNYLSHNPARYPSQPAKFHTTAPVKQTASLFPSTIDTSRPSSLHRHAYQHTKIAPHVCQNETPHCHAHDSSTQESTASINQTTLQHAQQIALHGIMALDLRDEKRARFQSSSHFDHVDDSREAETGQQPDTVQTSLPTRQSNPHWFIGFALLTLCVVETRRRPRTPWLMLVLLLSASLLWTACAAPAAPGMGASSDAPQSAPPPPDVPAPSSADHEPTTPVSRPRLRQFFPETLLWLPETITDEEGRVQIEIPIADSITTWRVSVTAIDAVGNLGSAQMPLPVFQDFFVSPQVPTHLTQGDELEIPVSVFNYLDEAQEIRLELTDAEWFEARMDPETEMTYKLAANEVTVAYVPLHVTGVGPGRFTLTAFGTEMSDAIQHEVDIVYNGEEQTFVQSGVFTGTIEQTFSLPPELIYGTQRATLKVYPNTISQLRASLNGMLEQPLGCFEQVASQNFINSLVLDYLQSVELEEDDSLQWLRRRSKRLAQIGYQRILVFESSSRPGGFGQCGHYLPQPSLTAYGLMQFATMSKVRDVEPAVLQRMGNYLYREQLPNGSWPAGRMRYYGNWDAEQAQLVTTAFITWALLESSGGYDYRLNTTFDYLYEQVSALDLDPYASALVVNALLTVPEQNRPTIVEEMLDIALEQLLKSARTKDGLTFWRASQSTLMGGYGRTADLETTALASHALLQSGTEPQIARSALDYLLTHRDKDGTFFSSQTTVFALRALLLAAQSESLTGKVSLTVAVNNRVERLELDRSRTVVQTLHFDDIQPGDEIRIAHDKGLHEGVEDSIALPYQIITEYHLPWETVAEQTQEQTVEGEAIHVQVDYDQFETAVNELVQVEATVELQMERRPGMVLVQVGIPPGFTALQPDLDELVASRLVNRYELKRRKVLFYLSGLAPKRAHTFGFGLLARTPGVVLSSPAIAYPYYTPEIRGVVRPKVIVIGR
ncbi:hypothetical protein KFU94_03475 [Chloroflexi bacterium TSY]|nr:hypothetical protein [Chloroflexi bacterium TSY]